MTCKMGVCRAVCLKGRSDYQVVVDFAFAYKT
jgi:hypothetical protein